MPRRFRAALFLAAALVGLAQPALSQSVSSCAQYSNVTVGSYIIQSNYWNQGCGGSGAQCVTVNTSTGAFTATGTFNCAPNVASYPSIYYGCHFGSSSPGTNLPMLVSSVTCATSSWDFTPPSAPTTADSYDIAYDIWFAPATHSTCASDSGGYAGGAELMIWLNYNGNVPVPAGSVTVASGISLAGYTWNLYETPPSTL